MGEEIENSVYYKIHTEGVRKGLIGEELISFFIKKYKTLKSTSEKKNLFEDIIKLINDLDDKTSKAILLEELSSVSKLSLKKIDMLKNTSTPIYPSTPCYTLRSWGGFFTINKKKILVERINEDEFIYNFNDEFIGISEVTWIKEDENGKKIKPKPLLKIKGYCFNFKDDKLSKIIYNTPNKEIIDKYLDSKFKPRQFKEIAKDIVTRLKKIYDFSFKTDPYIITLFIGQSYLKPIIPSFFYLGVDATKGGGKTTLLEIICLLSRHGSLAGDISASAIPRIIEDQDISLGVDELDQKIGKDSETNIISILRKGQRKGNFYIRCKKNTLEPEYFDVAGSHCYSYRSEVEDAFAQRSLISHTTPSGDNKLPVINLFKEHIVRDLTDELFLWGIENSIEISKDSKFNQNFVDKCSSVEGCIRVFGHREKIYSSLTDNLNSSSLDLLNALIGRNVELCYMALQISKLLNWDEELLIHLKEVMVTKHKDEGVSNDYYLEILEKLLIEIWKEESDILKEGQNEGYRFYPKNLAYEKYCQYLVGRNVKTKSSKKFSSFLLDLGFVKNISITSQRFKKATPRPCLIFNQEVCERIGVEVKK